MCGIFCAFSDDPRSDNLKTYTTCKEQLNRRGPDSQHVQIFSFSDYNFIFAASVLWLQGENVVKQPIETSQSVFVYNGNLYDTETDSFESDTQLFLNRLENSQSLSCIVSNFKGPFAFIYLDKRTAKLYFGRDIYGRRSLLVCRKNNHIVLTSVASKMLNYNCIELPSIGVFCYDLKEKKVQVVPWKYRHKNYNEKLTEFEKFLDCKFVTEDCESAPKYYIYKSPRPEDLACYEELATLGEQDAFSYLLINQSWKSKVEQLGIYLRTAVQRRIAAQPKFCTNCIKNKQNCSHALVGILFSGGVDCSILTLMADSFVDPNRPIDLLNVSFNKNAPDKFTALQTLEELRILRPNRKWNFIEIDVSKEELDLKRTDHITDLIFPRATILDDSLGCALWFASQGQNCNYKSPCRVLLVGSGADELFGGYSKYRAAMRTNDWLRVQDCLMEDWQNISHRNLARDDRVVSDHGRQLCTPYLDEDVVDYVISLNWWEKTYPVPQLAEGVGEKILLRSLAYDMGLKSAAHFRKRALQFGSRIANSKENANDISPRL